MDDTPASPASPDDARASRAVVAALAVAACLLAVAAFRAGPNVNPDAIAYLQTARHYAEGRTDLAVNGYWGPLLSWLAAPLLRFGVEPLLAGRLVAALGGLTFLAGLAALLRASRVSPTARAVGVWAALAPAVAWSAEQITPDLLLAGLLAFATATLLRPDAPTSRRVQIAAGALFGAAYLTKAVALPTAALMCVAVALLRRVADGAPWRRLFVFCAWTFGTAALVALPWIVVLSVKYQRPTFSTTGAIAHAVVGPGDVDRYYPTFRTFHVPDAGRVTSWEDPTSLKYAEWKTFASAGLLRHQVRVALNNAQAILDYLRGLDLLSLGLAGSVLALVGIRRGALKDEPWRWSLVLAACTAAAFVPVFAYGLRYYYAAYPFLLAGALGLAESLARDGRRTRAAALALVGASFLLTAVSFDIPGWPYSVPARASFADALRGGGGGRGAAARELAQRLAAKGLSGPVAGDSRDALYVAWFLGAPCHGEEPSPSADRVLQSGAAIFVARRTSPLVPALAADARFERVDGPSGAPLEAFRIR
jgi:hypothetical protein